MIYCETEVENKGPDIIEGIEHMIQKLQKQAESFEKSRFMELSQMNAISMRPPTTVLDRRKRKQKPREMSQTKFILCVCTVRAIKCAKIQRHTE